MTNCGARFAPWWEVGRPLAELRNVCSSPTERPLQRPYLVGEQGVTRARMRCSTMRSTSAGQDLSRVEQVDRLVRRGHRRPRRRWSPHLGRAESRSDRWDRSLAAPEVHLSCSSPLSLMRQSSSSATGGASAPCLLFGCLGIFPTTRGGRINLECAGVVLCASRGPSISLARSARMAPLFAATGMRIVPFGETRRSRCSDWSLFPSRYCWHLSP